MRFCLQPPLLCTSAKREFIKDRIIFLIHLVARRSSLLSFELNLCRFPESRVHPWCLTHCLMSKIFSPETSRTLLLENSSNSSKVPGYYSLGSMSRTFRLYSRKCRVRPLLIYPWGWIRSKPSVQKIQLLFLLPSKPYFESVQRPKATNFWFWHAQINIALCASYHWPALAARWSARQCMLQDTIHKTMKSHVWAVQLVRCPSFFFRHLEFSFLALRSRCFPTVACIPQVLAVLFQNWSESGQICTPSSC